MTTDLPPAGWYPDPSGRPSPRYWDGHQWRRDTRPPIPRAHTPAPPSAGEPRPPDRPAMNGGPQGPTAPAWSDQSAAPTVVTGGRTASADLAPVKRVLAQLPATSWLLFGGFVLVVIGMFFPWVTVSAAELGLSVSASPPGSTVVLVCVIVAVAAWLTWPTISTSPVSNSRRIALTVAVGLLIALIVANWFLAVHDESDARDSGVSVSPAFGTFVYLVGCIAMAVGIFRVWKRNSV
ncbi:MAG: DUF2510 domain-containing protein [Nocardia sp.]|nr:DUF2510 domain-containing protein [Nocardia sp.]